MIELIEHAVFTLVLAVLISIYYKKGPQQFIRVVVLGLKELPGVKGVIDKVLKNEVSSFVKTTSLGQDLVTARPRVVMPEKGTHFKPAFLAFRGNSVCSNLSYNKICVITNIVFMS